MYQLKHILTKLTKKKTMTHITYFFVIKVIIQNSKKL